VIIGPVTGFTPRPYQEHCINGGDPRRGIGIMPAFARYKRVLAVMATGCGKTEVYLSVIRRYLESAKTPPEKRAMLIAHRDELVSQPIERAPRFGLRFAREQGPDTAIGKPERAIASTIQSLTANRVRSAATALGYRFEKKRKKDPAQAVLGVEPPPKKEKGDKFTVWSPAGAELGRFDIEAFTKLFKETHPGVPTCRMEEYDPNEIGLIVLDECHHSASDEHMKVLEYFIHAFVLGVTATPKRLDGIGLEEVFEAVAYHYPIEQARPDGWLVDARVTEHPIEGLDLSQLRKRAGDLPPEALGELMAEYSLPVAANIVRLAGERPTIVFCATVAHAHSQAAALRRYTDARVEVADGSTDKEIRRDVVADFRAGQVQYLVNAMLWTEGFDAPNASCIALVRPTCSRSLLLQCLDMSTQVLTRRGWLSQPDVREDDILAAFVPLTSEILWRPLLSAVVRHLAPDEVMYGVESPTLSLRVTGGHRLLACRRRGRAHAWGGWEFSTAEDLAAHKDMWRVPVSGVEAAPGVPLTDDEIRFIGWVLTDGTITRCAGKPSTIRICQAVGQPWVDEIDRVLISCGFKYRKFEFTPRDAFPNAQNQYAWTISHGKPRGTDKHLRGWGVLEPYISKDFPSTLDDLDRRQFGVLLSAMHLGDGCKQPKGVEWTQRSYHLCMGNNLLMTERLQSLCVRRGYKANITRASAQYLLHIKDTAFRALGGKAAQDRPHLVPVHTDPDELVWCVENDVGTIITRRNGKVCIVGNCLGRGTRPEPRTVDRPELRDDPAGRVAAIAASNKPDLLVLDFTGQVKVVGLASPADVLAGELTAEQRLALSKIPLVGDRTIDELTREAIRLAAAAAAEAAALSDAVADDAEVLDPWDPSIVMSMKLPRDDPQEARCSPAQAAYLTRCGIESAEKLSASRAKTLSGALAVRQKRNLCTYKQQLALQKVGVPPSTTTRMYIETAAKLIDQLVSNRWRRPKAWDDQPKLGGRAPTEARA